METLLVTGVAGFIGSHVANHLQKKGHKIYGVDDLSSGKIENIPKEIGSSQSQTSFKKGSFTPRNNYERRRNIGRSQLAPRHRDTFSSKTHAF